MPNTVCCKTTPTASECDRLLGFLSRAARSGYLLNGCHCFQRAPLIRESSGRRRRAAVAASRRTNFTPMQIIWLQATRCSSTQDAGIRVHAEPEFGQTGTDKSTRGAGETVIFYIHSCTLKIGVVLKLLWDESTRIRKL